MLSRKPQTPALMLSVPVFNTADAIMPSCSKSVSRHLQTGISPLHTIWTGTLTKSVTAHITRQWLPEVASITIFRVPKTSVDLLQPRCAFPNSQQLVLPHSDDHLHTFMTPYSHEFRRL